MNAELKRLHRMKILNEMINDEIVERIEELEYDIENNERTETSRSRASLARLTLEFYKKSVFLRGGRW